MSRFDQATHTHTYTHQHHHQLPWFDYASNLNSLQRLEQADEWRTCSFDWIYDIDVHPLIQLIPFNSSFTDQFHLD